MLQRIVQFSLRYRGVVMVLGCATIAYGLYVAAHSKLDVFPEFAPPQVVIQTEAPGLSPEEVEVLVTRPIENSVNGAPDLVTIRSQSIQGLSAITATFSDHAEIFRVRQMVSERLTQVAGSLPQRVKAPKMGPLISSTSKVLVIGLTSTNRTLMELRTFADWTARPRLLAVPGVAKVEVFGGEVRQIQIQVNPRRLVDYGLALEDVLTAAGRSTAVRGAGFVDSRNQRIVLRTEGQSLTPAQLGQVVLAHHNGQSVRLQDVAKVVEGPEPKFGDAQILGERGVVMEVYGQYRANTMEVTRAVEEALAEMAPAFASQNITVHPLLFRPANFIEASISNVGQSLIIGGLLVAVVLFFFLLDWRTAFISFASIPLSLLAAVIVLDRFGVSLNTLTLGGFAIAIGVVVDDAIIDVENILRRVRENLTRSQPRPLFQVVLDASLEVRSAVVYATFIVALVFWLRSPLTAPKVLGYTPLTSDRERKFPPLVTDGTRLYFMMPQKDRWTLAEVSTSGGETAAIPSHLEGIWLDDISPDGSQLLIGQSSEQNSDGPVYTLPLPAGLPRRVGDILANEIQHGLHKVRETSRAGFVHCTRRADQEKKREQASQPQNHDEVRDAQIEPEQLDHFMYDYMVLAHR